MFLPNNEIFRLTNNKTDNFSQLPSETLLMRVTDSTKDTEAESQQRAQNSIFLYEFPNIFIVNMDSKWSPMGWEWSPTIPRHFWVMFAENHVSLRMSISLENYFCNSRPHMAALANPSEAKCSYFDPLSFMCSPKLDQNIALYLKMLTSTPVFLTNTLFHLEPSLN